MAPGHQIKVLIQVGWRSQDKKHTFKKLSSELNKLQCDAQGTHLKANVNIFSFASISLSLVFRSFDYHHRAGESFLVVTQLCPRNAIFYCKLLKNTPNPRALYQSRLSHYFRVYFCLELHSCVQLLLTPDMCFVIAEEAENIMVAEADRLNLPHGPPTFESIEKARRAKSHLPPLSEKWGKLL